MQKKTTIFAKLQFFADSKSRAQELSNDVSFVIFGHQTWDLEGGSNWPPPSVSWFSSTSSRDRVKYVKRLIKMGLNKKFKVQRSKLKRKKLDQKCYLMKSLNVKGLKFNRFKYKLKF